VPRAARAVEATEEGWYGRGWGGPDFAFGRADGLVGLVVLIILIVLVLQVSGGWRWR
jgi:hypothetical protein